LVFKISVLSLKILATYNRRLIAILVSMNPIWNTLIISMWHSEHPTGGDDQSRKYEELHIYRELSQIEKIGRL